MYEAEENSHIAKVEVSGREKLENSDRVKMEDRDRSEDKSEDTRVNSRQGDTKMRLL